MGAAGCCFVLLAGHVWIPLHAIMGEVCCRGLACHHSLVMTLPSCHVAAVLRRFLRFGAKARGMNTLTSATRGTRLPYNSACAHAAHIAFLRFGSPVYEQLGASYIGRAPGTRTRTPAVLTISRVAPVQVLHCTSGLLAVPRAPCPRVPVSSCPRTVRPSTRCTAGSPSSTPTSRSARACCSALGYVYPRIIAPCRHRRPPLFPVLAWSLFNPENHVGGSTWFSGEATSHRGPSEGRPLSPGSNPCVSTRPARAFSYGLESSKHQGVV